MAERAARTAWSTASSVGRGVGAMSAVDAVGPTEPTTACTCACGRRLCPLPARRPGGQTALMQLPAEAVTATVLIEVVRISALPTGRDVPYPGTAVAHWAGSEAAAALALIENLPGSEQHRCGFSPGWSVRAYDDSLDLALFEAAFCFTCHEVRMHGTTVPPALATQFFDPTALPARTLLSLFRKTAP
jgi:hypothetical protein